WGVTVNYALLAYNDFTPATDPTTGESVLMTGFEATAPGATTLPLWTSSNGAKFVKTANYLVRHANGTYDVRSMEDPTIASPPPRVSIRAMAVSPFDADRASGGVVYAGGFDANETPVDDTAWALRGPLGVALGR